MTNTFCPIPPDSVAVVRDGDRVFVSFCYELSHPLLASVASQALSTGLERWLRENYPEMIVEPVEVQDGP